MFDFEGGTLRGKVGEVDRNAESLHSASSPLAVVHGPKWTPEADTPSVLPGLLANAARDPARNRLVYLAEDGSVRIESYVDLLETAERVRAGLQGEDVIAGAPVLLQLPRHRDFLAALWGCFLGGFLPLPIPTPSSYSEPSSQLEKFRFGWQWLEGPLILTEAACADRLRAAGPPSSEHPFRVTAIEDLREQPNQNAWHCSQPDDPALAMMTSGSTDRPKVVVLTHSNLVCTAMASVTALALGPNDTNLNWMPLEHIGALAFHVRDVAAGSSQVHVPTEYVLERPLRWLDLLDRYGATVCWAPNFAFRLVNDHAEELKSGHWDLTAVRVLLNGSEPIVPHTASRFLELLQPHGLSRTCMVPCWGMSETAAAVTFGHRFRPGAGPARQTHVETGSPIPGVSLRIVDGDGNIVPEGVIGQLEVRGLSVTPGYFRDDQATQQSLAGEGWWRTGDLGRLRDGQLTVTGREKTLIIINGVNYSSYAIEAVTSEVPGVDATHVAASAVRSEADDTEVLAVFFSPRCDSPTVTRELAAEIRRRIVQRIGVNPRYVISLQPDEIPKTVTGKIKHLELRQKFHAGEFCDRCIETDSAPSVVLPEMDEVERCLADAFCSVLQRERVGLDESFFDLGGDSLKGMQVISRVRDSLGIPLPARELFLVSTVRQLAERLRAFQGRLADGFHVVKVDRRQELPLSSAQQRLWVLAQLDPTSPAYHVSAAVDYGDPSVGALELLGPLDVHALEQSLETIVRRHESLRTTIPTSEGRPRQVIQPARPIRLQLVDVRELDSVRSEEAIHREAVRQQQEPFDLTQGPLWRACLLRLEDERFLLFLTLHHIICDGWSVGNLRRELTACYAAYREGKTPDLPPLPVQYADYAVWERQPSADVELDEQRAFWRRRLDELSPLRLPTDHPRSNNPSHRGGLRGITVPESLAVVLKGLARREGVTLFITLLAAYKALLSRYLDQTDIAVGSPIANRSRREFEGMIGCFVNTLVLRTDVGGNPTFRQLLLRVRETAFEAYSHQDFPFERLVEELQPARNPDGNPLFQVMFAVHNLPLEPPVLDGLTVRSRKFETSVVRFDAQWDIWEDADSLRINVFYRSDLFDDATVDRWLHGYRTLLKGIAADPDRHLSELPLVTRDQRRRMLHDFSGVCESPPPAACVHEVFERQVARAPDAAAVVCEDRQWSYAELNERANRIACHLRDIGVGPETVVALACDRSLELIAALLGVLKAGGAYLPLDVSQPVEGWKQVLEESEARVLLADRELEPRLAGFTSRSPDCHPANAAPEPIWLDEAMQAPSTSHATANRSSHPVVDNLACVMCTSGTTGRPKAIGVLHRGVVRLVRDVQYVDISPDDVFLQLSAPAFDASTFEIWGALLNGARLVLPPPGLPSLEELEQLLHGHGVTILWLTAGLFHLLVPRKPEALNRLRILLAGGDVLSPQHVNAFFQQSGGHLLVNGYGPTENTTFTCCHRMTSAVQPGAAVPIGRPISQTHVYVLDAEMHPVPIGAVGELYMGGSGLTRGYLNQPAATAERYLPDPFSRKRGARLYRSGDLVRYRADGVLEFLGRKDHQLKIRGYRIEPGEIEAALRGHPAIREAVVTAREVDAGVKQLVGYVVTDRQDVATELRAFLRNRFPERLVPQAIVPVAVVPLTPQGKVDYDALPAPRLGAPATGRQYAAPRTATEAKLAEIWSTVLNVPRIGIHDNFFDLGGESLLAIQAISRIWDELQVAVSLRRLFAGPTVAELALAVTRQFAGESDVRLLATTLDEVERLDEEEAAARAAGGKRGGDG